MGVSAPRAEHRELDLSSIQWRIQFNTNRNRTLPQDKIDNVNSLQNFLQECRSIGMQ